MPQNQARRHAIDPDDCAVYWFAVYEGAIFQGDICRATEARDQLKRIGYVITRVQPSAARASRKERRPGTRQRSRPPEVRSRSDLSHPGTAETPHGFEADGVPCEV